MLLPSYLTLKHILPLFFEPSQHTSNFVWESETISTGVVVNLSFSSWKLHSHLSLLAFFFCYDNKCTSHNVASKYCYIPRDLYNTQKSFNNYNKFRLKKKPMIEMLCTKIKLKQVNIFRIFASKIIMQKKNVKDE